METLYILLFLLLLAALYGVYALARLLFRHIFPLKPRLAVSCALAAAIVCMAALGIAAGGLLSGTREQAFAQGYDDGLRESAAAAAQERAEVYSEAYTKGYTDAVDGYLAARLAEVPDARGGEDRPEADEAEGADELLLLPDPEEEGEDAPAVQDRTMPDTEEEGTESEPAREPTGVTVYYTESGSVLHFDPDCSYLKNASKVLSCDLADAPDRKHCSRCG